MSPAAAAPGPAAGGRPRAAPWHLATAVLALALVLLTALDWYGSQTGEEARQVERFAAPDRPGIAILEEGTADRAREVAEREERTLWQAGTGFDRLLLAALLLTAALALVAAVRGGRAIERAAAAEARAGPAARRPLAAPAAWAALAVGALLLVRVVARPDAPAGETIHSGLPLAMLTLGLLAFTAGRAARAERAAAAPAAHGRGGGGEAAGAREAAETAPDGSYNRAG